MTCLTLLGDIPNIAAIRDGYMSFEWSSFIARCRASTTSAVLDLESMASLGMSDSSVTRVITRSASSASLGIMFFLLNGVNIKVHPVFKV